MTEIWMYITKVILIQVFLYSFYLLVLRRSKRHSWNRYFLLGSLILGFLIPLIEIPGEMRPDQWEHDAVVTWIEQSVDYEEWVIVKSQDEDTSKMDFLAFLPWVYVGITCLLVSRSFLYLGFLQRVKKQSEYVNKKWFKLFKTSDTRSFSFFSNVFIPKKVFGTQAFNQILAHECVHVKQGHSIDRLLVEFIVSLFWFNPFIYLYRNALIEIHEFQADEAVIKEFNDPLAYQEVLYDQLHHATYSGLVSHFNFSMIKKRIVMINTQNNKKTRLLYLMAFPAIAAILFAFSSREAMEPIENAGNELAEILAPEMKEPPYEELQLPQGEHIPSIFPLKEVEAIRLSSSFGRRMDPIDKVEKHHNGIDFATARGNEVIATADGEVVFAGRDGRHGNRVKIKHGETYLTTYSHLESISVYNGQKVSKGDVIALSGNTGASTAPHLHYGVSKNGKYVNPTDYIKDYDFKRKVKIKEKSKDKVKTKEKDQKTTYKVLIDAGHGGKDEGAISPSGITEKELSLAIAQKIQVILESEDKIVVELSRHVDTELSLQDRVDMTTKADLLISLHTDNYSEEGSFVFPVYYPDNEFSERSLELANHLVDEFEKIGKEAKSGYSDGYKVLRDAACPAVIFNYGFFSDPEEEQFLSSESGQQQVANGIAEAVKSSLL